MTAWKSPGEKVRDNITGYRLPPVLVSKLTPKFYGETAGFPMSPRYSRNCSAVRSQT